MTLSDLTDQISPFPGTGNLLFDHRSSEEEGGAGSVVRLQKLQPIRNHGGGTREIVLSEVGFESELGFESDVVPLQCIRRIGSDGDLQRREGGSGGGGGGSSTHRWPEEETLALLRIRMEMVAQFRDPDQKKSLWDIISMKLGQMGYNRSPKKCKEKFENVFKYYKRAKEKLMGGEGSVDGKKVYKYFTELEALENQKENAASGTRLSEKDTFQALESMEIANALVGLQTSTSSLVLLNSSVDVALEDDRNDDRNEDKEKGALEMFSGKRKRKCLKEMEKFCRSILDEMTKKHEEMLKQLIERMDKRDKDWIVMQEDWKKQQMETERMQKEMRDLRDQVSDRSLTLISSIAKDMGYRIDIPQCPQSLNSEEIQEQEEVKRKVRPNRWPHPEAQALITLRTVMDPKFQNFLNGDTDFPVWEEISQAMSALGYKRSAERCKEKWEHMNKFFMRALASSKSHPENAKTCPYFRELKVVYNNRMIEEMNSEEENRSTKPILDSAGVSNVFSVSQTSKRGKFDTGTTER